MKQLYRKMQLTILVFLVIISIFTFSVVYRPLREGLEQGVIDNYQQIAVNKHLILEKFLNEGRDNALDLSSRQETADMLEHYLSGSISFKELQDYTIPTYNDVIESFSNKDFVARISSDGKVVHSLGDPEGFLGGGDFVNIVDLINWENEELTSTYLYEEKAVIVQSPIVRNDSIIGYDIIVNKIGPETFEIEEGTYIITIIPENMPSEVILRDGKIISYIYCDTIDATLTFTMDASVAFSEIRQLTLKSAITHILGLLIMLVIIQVFLVRYVRKFAKNQYKLKIAAEESYQERSLLIDKMTKGFVIVRRNNKENIYKSYEIIYSNPIFMEMTGTVGQNIEGMNLFDILPIVSDAAHERVSDILSHLDTNLEEIFMDRANRWWDISTYSPKQGHLVIICEDVTDKKIVIEKTRDSEEIMKAIFEVSGEGLWDWHIDARLVFHNAMWARVLGYDEGVGTHDIDVFANMIHPDDRDRVVEGINKTAAGLGDYSSEHRMIKKDGTQIWVVHQGTLLGCTGNKPGRMIGSIKDITKRKQDERESLLEKEFFQSTIRSVGDGIITTDKDGIITIINPSAQDLVGLAEDQIIGINIDEALPIFDSDSMEEKQIFWFDNIKDKINTKGENRSEIEVFLLTKDGKILRISKKVSPIILPGGEHTGFVIVFRDVTESYESQKKLYHLSLYDSLTGLYNRRSMEDALQKLDTKENLPLTLIIIDVNNLKLANDVFGHIRGDKVLKKTAEFLKDILRQEDFIARIGGDEFCILLPRTSSDVAIKIKAKIQNESEKYKVGSVILSLAVGFGVKTREHENIQDVFAEADTFMYHHKRQSRQFVKERTLNSFINYNNANIYNEKQHSHRVSVLASALYEAIGKPPNEVKDFASVALLHDIGKISVSYDILNKKTKLLESEMREIRSHSQASYQILRAMNEYENYAEAVLYHHEWVDGTGYPQGLVGNEIPLEARIITIADAYEAMTSDRPYRKAISKTNAIKELRRCAGTQFDNTLVEIFIEKVL